jgi:hypothetical protein
VRIAILAGALVGLASLLACTDNDRDEQQTGGSKAVADQQTAAQKPAQKPDADEGEEGEEGPATPAAAAAEKPVPQQTSGKQFVYNFDSDTPGLLPAKFHSATTGGGAREKWVVTADPTAPSKPVSCAGLPTDRAMPRAGSGFTIAGPRVWAVSPLSAEGEGPTEKPGLHGEKALTGRNIKQISESVAAWKCVRSVPRLDSARQPDS